MTNVVDTPIIICATPFTSAAAEANNALAAGEARELTLAEYAAELLAEVQADFKADGRPPAIVALGAEVERRALDEGQAPGDAALMAEHARATMYNDLLTAWQADAARRAQNEPCARKHHGVSQQLQYGGR